MDASAPNRFDTIVIGGGESGLAAGYYLTVLVVFQWTPTSAPATVTPPVGLPAAIFPGDRSPCEAAPSK